MLLLLIFVILAPIVPPATYSLFASYFNRTERTETTNTVFSAFVLAVSILYLFGLYLFPYIVESIGRGYLNESFAWDMVKIGLFVWIGAFIFVGLCHWVLNLFRWKRQKSPGGINRFLLQMVFLGGSFLALLFYIVIPYSYQDGWVQFRDKEKMAFAGYIHFVEEKIDQGDSLPAVRDWMDEKIKEKSRGYECTAADREAMRLRLPIRYVSFKPSLLDMKVSIPDENGEFSDFDEKTECVYIRISMPWGDDKLFERGDKQGLIVFPKGDRISHPPLPHHEAERKDGRIWIHYIEPNAYIWREIYPYYLIEEVENLPVRPITGNRWVSGKESSN